MSPLAKQRTDRGRPGNLRPGKIKVAERRARLVKLKGAQRPRIAPKKPGPRRGHRISGMNEGRPMVNRAREVPHLHHGRPTAALTATVKSRSRLVYNQGSHPRGTGAAAAAVKAAQ